MSYEKHPCMGQAEELYRAARVARETAVRHIDAAVDYLIDLGVDRHAPERTTLAEWRLDLIGAVREESPSGLVVCESCSNPINPPSSSRFCLDCHTAEIERQLLEARRGLTRETIDEHGDPREARPFGDALIAEEEAVAEDLSIERQQEELEGDDVQ